MTAISTARRVRFTTNKADCRLISKIAARAAALRPDLDIDRLTIIMDVSATHANGCPLALGALLAADDFNFLHDVLGIHRHLNRDTGRLAPVFSPRFSLRETVVRAS